MKMKIAFSLWQFCGYLITLSYERISYCTDFIFYFFDCLDPSGVLIYLFTSPFQWHLVLRLGLLCSLWLCYCVPEVLKSSFARFYTTNASMKFIEWLSWNRKKTVLLLATPMYEFTSMLVGFFRMQIVQQSAGNFKWTRLQGS